MYNKVQASWAGSTRKRERCFGSGECPADNPAVLRGNRSYALETMPLGVTLGRPIKNQRFRLLQYHNYITGFVSIIIGTTVATVTSICTEHCSSSGICCRCICLQIQYGCLDRGMQAVKLTPAVTEGGEAGKGHWLPHG